MSRFSRKTVLALAALASIGAFALASNDASARGFGGGGGGMRMSGGHGMHVGGGGFRHIGGGSSFRHIGGVRHPGFNRPMHLTHHYPHFRHYPNFHWRYGWRRNYWIAPVVTTGIATGVATSVVSAPTYNRCSCLTKEYTPEGAVVFKDVCTNEAAMNSPQPSPTAYDPSQQPQIQTR
jgi:hypothetical protein